MTGVGRQQAIAALIFLVAALFVASGYAPAARWRRPLRAAAIACFVLAVIAALVEIGRWLADPGGW